MEGEFGLELDTDKVKRGNGATAWNSLAYWAGSVSAVSSVNGQTGVVVLTTTNIAEGTNLYYTNARADARIAAAVGVSVQAYDLGLTSLAAFPTTADRIAYSTAINVWAETVLTSFARTLLDDASAADGLLTLGAAPLASPTFTGTPAAPTAAGGTNTTQLATTAFVTSAVASAVTGVLEFKGSIDASANPNYPAASTGDLYYVSVAGKVGGASGKDVAVGDAVIAKADNAGGDEAAVGTSWFVLEKNLNGALLSANNLSDVANASTARTNLGLAIGTNVQAQDATLQSLSALGTAADKIAYTTAIDTWAETALTAFARTLLDDLTQAAAQTTLGLGTGDSPAFAGVVASATVAGGDVHIDVRNLSGAASSTATLLVLADAVQATLTANMSGLVKLDTSFATSLVIATEGTTAFTITATAIVAALPTQIPSIELGHATDTTITRVSAGVIAVEGSNVLLASGIGSIVQAYDADLTTWAGITPGANVGTALAVAVGTDGAFVVKGGALGTPSSGVLTNATGLPTTGLVDDAVTLAKMAAGTAGNLITYDASGNPAAVATGTATHVLTSNGAGAAPTFQAAAGGSLDEGLVVRLAQMFS